VCKLGWSDCKCLAEYQEFSSFANVFVYFQLIRYDKQNIILKTMHSGLLYITLYIKLKVCLFVPYTNSHFWTKLYTHLPLGLEETVEYVWSENVWPFLPFWPSSGASAESSARNGCRRESSATALYPWFLLVLVWRHGNDVVADDSFAFLVEVSSTMGNA